MKNRRSVDRLFFMKKFILSLTVVVLSLSTTVFGGSLYINGNKTNIQTQKIDNGMLEKRAEYLFSIIENRNNRLLKFNLQEADYDMLEFYPHEMTSVHFSFFLKEVDEVISKLLKKYKFSDKKRKEFDYVNIL